MAEFFLPGLRNVHTRIRRAQIDLMPAEMHRFRADGLCRITQDFFKQIRHGVHVPIGLVEFHHGKFRVMGGVYPFVAEHMPNFVNFVHTAHNQAFVVQFQRNAQVQRHFKRVVIRFKRARNGPAGRGV